LSFVFYAESEASASLYMRQTGTQDKADIDADLILAYFLNQFLYDTTSGQSAMLGHSLSRTMYGLNPNDFNTYAFTGMGRLRFTDPVLGVDNYYLINNQTFGGVVRQPEFYNGRYLGGANVPWTYADAENMFLAIMNADGEILVPSFHRPWIASTPVPAGVDKYLVLYPKEITSEEGAGAPHVKNADLGKGLKKPGGGYYNNDSYWMDLGFPIMTAPNGKRFKPLFAALVIDLDGKVNISAPGNIRGRDAAGNIISVSNSGVGPWEINLTKVLTQSDWVNLFKGNATAGLRGRYGPDGQPGTAGSQIPLSPAGTD